METGEDKDQNMEERRYSLRDSSSDDDSEMLPSTVENYWLEDGNENPVSLSALPFLEEESNLRHTNHSLFLRGTTDRGLQSVYLKVDAWKIDSSRDDNPVFFLRTAGKHWIEILKPRKSYEEVIRSLLVVAQFLDFVQRNLDASEKSVWNHLIEAFPSFEREPSSNDLFPHVYVIEYYARLKGIESSAVLNGVVSSVSRSRPALRDAAMDMEFVCANKSEIEDTFDMEEDVEDGTGEMDFEEFGDLSDPVCSICDNGGDILCCEGPCMRSFHLNKEAKGADDADCATLGFSKKEVERMEKYFCPNCQYKQHQCFACGELGCSDDSLDPAQEVFICDVAMCGRFYHPLCVSKLLESGNENGKEIEALAEGIRAGQGFSCPIHKCQKCGKGEVADEEDHQFAVCRRCPRAWHRKCLPSYISFDGTDDEPERAWEGLLSNNRILIFCKRHKIIPDLGTPRRNHLKFPGRPDLSSKIEPQAKKRKLDTEPSVKEDVQTKRAKPKFQVTKSKPDLDTAMTRGKPDVTVKSKPELHRSDPQTKKGKSELNVPETYTKEKIKRDSDTKLITSSAPSETTILEKHMPLPKAFASKVNVPLKKRENLLSGGNIISFKDTEIRSTIEAIIKRSREATTLESVIHKHNVPSCYQRHSKTADKRYSLTKIESIIKAMRRAVETMDKGGSIEDAKTICSGTFVKFLDGCRRELKVYLAPFLHGMRYTSFGRHFTKYDKLQEVVDRLQWYVENGDMIVDMCCGSNDFSILMKEKMAQARKTCEFKNFDIILPKNDFNFVKRDWFQVEAKELTTGSRLIIGLNPPFGLKGALANSFINQALRFKPKLIILIVPKETERLDQKPDKYTLIWEDPDLLKGESFYLPGSVDVDKNPLNDWNLVAPPLYLWSRPDWVQRHQEIALQQGHVSKKSISDPSPRYAGDPWERHFMAPDPLPLPDSRLESLLGKQRSDMGKSNQEQLAAPIEPASKGDAEAARKLVPFQPDDVAALNKVNMGRETHAINDIDGYSEPVRESEKSMIEKTHNKTRENDGDNGFEESPASKYVGSKVNSGMKKKLVTQKFGKKDNKHLFGGKKEKNFSVSDNVQEDKVVRHADGGQLERHNGRDRHESTGRSERHEDKGKHHSWGKYDDRHANQRRYDYLRKYADRDKHDIYEPQGPWAKEIKHSEQTASPQRDGKKHDLLQAAHPGREMQRMKDGSSMYAAETGNYDKRRPEMNDIRFRQSKAESFEADQGLEMAKAFGSDELTEKVNPYEDESQRRKRQNSDAKNRGIHFPRNRSTGDQWSTVKDTCPDGNCRNGEFNKSDRGLPNTHVEESWRRELTDPAFSFDKSSRYNSVSRETRSHIDLYKEETQSMEFSDSNLQRREAAYAPRGYSQIAVDNYDSHSAEKYSTLSPQRGAREHFEPSLNSRQGYVGYRDLNMPGGRDQGHNNHGELRAQVSLLDFEGSCLQRNYNSSDALADIHKLNRSSNDWQHAPSKSEVPSEAFKALSNPNQMMSPLAKGTEIRHYSESTVDSLIDSVLGRRRDTEFPSHAPYSDGGRYAESRHYFPR